MGREGNRPATGPPGLVVLRLARANVRCGVAMACAVTLATTGSCYRDQTRLSPASGARLSSCAELATTFRFANTTITSAEPVPSGALTWGGDAIGAHCLVKGEMYRRTSPQDGKSYAIGFEMRLPDAWNGRFFYQANGGLDGRVTTALGGGGPVPNDGPAAGLCRHQLRRGPLRRRRSQLWHRLPGASGLRLPGCRQADTDGQGADRIRLRQASGSLVLRRLLERRSAHVRGDDAHARGVRRLPGGCAGLPSPAGGDRQPVRGPAVRDDRDGLVRSQHGLHHQRTRGGVRRGLGTVRRPRRCPRRNHPGHHGVPGSVRLRSRRSDVPRQSRRDMPVCGSEVGHRADLLGSGQRRRQRVLCELPVRQRPRQSRLVVLGVLRAPTDRFGGHGDDLGCAAGGPVDLRRRRLRAVHPDRQDAGGRGGDGCRRTRSPPSPSCSL